MSEISIRDLRNHGGDMVDRVAQGERMTVTRDGKPVALLLPLDRAPLSARVLLQRWSHLPAMDPPRSAVTSIRSSTKRYEHPRPPSRGVLDTSTVVLLERIDDPVSLPPEPLITAVTLAELSVGPLVATTPSEQATRQLRLQQAEADFDPLPSTPPRREPLGGWLHRCTAPAERRGLGPMTR